MDVAPSFILSMDCQAAEPSDSGLTVSGAVKGLGYGWLRQIVLRKDDAYYMVALCPSIGFTHTHTVCYRHIAVELPRTILIYLSSHDVDDYVLSLS